MSLRPYRVKENRQISANGTWFAAGQIVYLTREEAVYHAANLEPALDQTETDGPPFVEQLVAYKGQDFYQKWSLEQYAIDIQSAVYGNTQAGWTTIVCKEPHLLASGTRVTVRIVQGTAIAVEHYTVASVINGTTIIVPLEIVVPANPEIAEVAVPNDLTGSSFEGGIYDYVQAVDSFPLLATARCTVGSTRVVIFSRSRDESAAIQIGDRVRIVGAVASFADCVGKSQTVSDSPRSHETAYVLSAAATATLDTDQVFVERESISTSLGTQLRPFVFAGEILYGELTASMDYLQLDNLAAGKYPFQIIQRAGAVDSVLFRGTLEVIG